MFWVAASAAALWLLHRAALWAERRGWIYYRDKRASSSTASNAFMQVQALFEPRAEHVVEARASDEDRSEDSESGEPPPGG